MKIGEIIVELLEKIEQLEKQIEQMMNCENCKNSLFGWGDFGCKMIETCIGNSKWELKK